MAVVGFEMDQVRRTPEGDVSVPINAAYNHHFEATMVGAKSRFQKVKFEGPNDPRLADLHSMGHGVPNQKEHWMVEELVPGNDMPTSTAFGGANGGEYRKSYHGYAPGYVQLIEPPTQMQITPMQIDTWNRDHMSLTGPTDFVAGPLPRNSLARKDAKYSGLLECPVTSRLQKVVSGGYLASGAGSCSDQILSASECYAAAASTFGSANNSFANSQGSDASRPTGCSATTDKSDSSLILVYFNTLQEGAAQCGAGTLSLIHI
eukprot:TRINITY_DN23513_c0_g1_i1.p1 TRINITY_DN23513_c0_g1~~TRINITY_DN23513_c0_g1_i1.p1  ORF type:complete len:262 (-),score=54.98 TRINITY_DN23513_c0_g1_i1:185-970(-)